MASSLHHQAQPAALLAMRRLCRVGPDVCLIPLHPTVPSCNLRWGFSSGGAGGAVMILAYKWRQRFAGLASFPCIAAVIASCSCDAPSVGMTGLGDYCLLLSITPVHDTARPLQTSSPARNLFHVMPSRASRVLNFRIIRSAPQGPTRAHRVSTDRPCTAGARGGREEELRMPFGAPGRSGFRAAGRIDR